jgi:hypothetical protein
MLSVTGSWRHARQEHPPNDMPSGPPQAHGFRHRYGHPVPSSPVVVPSGIHLFFQTASNAIDTFQRVVGMTKSNQSVRRSERVEQWLLRDTFRIVPRRTAAAERGNPSLPTRPKFENAGRKGHLASKRSSKVRSRSLKRNLSIRLSILRTTRESGCPDLKRSDTRTLQ